MFSNTRIKSVSFIVFFLLISALTACGNGDKKSIKNTEDPFLTTGESALTPEQITQYQQRQVTEASYQQILAKVQETQKEVKKQGGNFNYQAINFNKKNSTVDIQTLEITANLVDPVSLAIKDFKDTKNISIAWYDDKNEIPYFIKASMHDIFIAKEDFLQSADGKEMVSFFEKLGVDHKQLNNFSDIAYDYNDSKGQISLAINNDFNKLINLRLVTKLDSISKQMYKVLAGDELVKNPAMILGLVSAVRLQEVYLKIKLEKTIEEIITAMPEKEAKEARKSYTENKNLSDAQIKKYIGNGYSAEQIKAYRTSWLNFLEQKKPLIISVKPDIPLAFSALFSSAMMAQQNPKMAEGFIEQLKLTISN